MFLFKGRRVNLLLYAMVVLLSFCSVFDWLFVSSFFKATTYTDSSQFVEPELDEIYFGKLVLIFLQGCKTSLLQSVIFVDSLPLSNLPISFFAPIFYLSYIPPQYFSTVKKILVQIHKRVPTHL